MIAELAAGPDPTVFIQYGAVGFIAAAALAAVKVLFGRLEKQYRDRDAERERELERANARADRLEAELSRVNGSMRESMIAMTAANQMVGAAMSRLRREE